MGGQRLIRWILGLVLLRLALFPLPGLAEGGPVYFFYQKVCESCNPQEEFAQTFFRLTGESLHGYDYLAYDADTRAGEQALHEALAGFGGKQGDIRYPVLVFGGRLYMGQDQILTDLPAYVLQSGAGTESFLYYISVGGCESCMRVDRLLAALAGTVAVRRGGITFQSPVRVQKVDLSAEPGMAAALFDAFHVPQGSRSAPMLLAGDGYWRGEENIGAFLKYSLPAGRAVGTPKLLLRGKAPALPWVPAGVCLGCLAASALFLAARRPLHPLSSRVMETACTPVYPER